MLLDKISAIGRTCTGCSLCKNICPVGAIEMLPNEDGFIRPKIDSGKCIHCEKCEKKCPQLNHAVSNEAEPPCYAVKMPPDVLEVSSSGGAFTALANYVFDKGGYVCGAAYDEDFRGVSQIMISDKADMYKLRGSKYVYSKPGNIYKQVYEKLNEGAYVLFSGVPCQVAALKAYLPKDFKKLITVDLLCGGYPPEKLFRQYVDSVAKGREIKNISFRSKKYSWYINGIRIEFTNGEEHIIHSMRDPYLKAYLKFMITSESCDNCQFAPTPRVGDFTIGDFWSFDKYDETVDLEKGISCILTNNKKSMEIFEEIKGSFEFVKRMPLSFLRRFNRMNEKRKPVLARQRFFRLIKDGWDFKKAVDYALNWKFDVAVSGCWTVPNYGGDLTYYALYNTIKDMGYSVIMVERRADIPGYDIPRPIHFGVNPYPFYDVCRIHKNFNDRAELNVRVKTFVLGSDQVWNYKIFDNSTINSYSFDYVRDYRRKVAYSTSFGSVELTGTPEQNKELTNLLRRFNAVSVREKSGVELCRQMGVKAEWVVDPVFLCDKKYFQKLIDSAKCSVGEKYVCSYIIHPSPLKYGIEKICGEFNMGHIGTITCAENSLAKEGFYQSNWPYPYEKNLTVENWLKYLTNSSFIITDSFHATCFAVRYNIPFIFVKGMMNETNGLERVQSILSVVGLMDRIVPTVEEAFEKKTYNQPIDWEQVNARMKPEIERSRQWLENALKAEII